MVDLITSKERLDFHSKWKSLAIHAIAYLILLAGVYILLIETTNAL